MAGWNVGTSAIVPPGAGITLVEGSSFCVGAGDGDVRAHLPQGLFFQDTRIVSDWRTRIDGVRIETISADIVDPHRAVLVGRVHSRRAPVESSLIVERVWTLGAGLDETLTLRNFSNSDRTVRVRVRIGADFADIFDVKAGRAGERRRVRRSVAGDRIVLDAGRGRVARGVDIHSAGARILRSGLEHRAVVPAHGSWSRTLHIQPVGAGRAPVPDLPARRSQLENIHREMLEWRGSTSRTTAGEDHISEAVLRSQVDLGSLRILDPAHASRTVLAAGAPWFMALFGRDSLISSLMAMPVDPSIALGTLKTLGERQGTRINAVTEEQPGKILHEVRLGAAVDTSLGGTDTYFGSVDATPLFVVTLGEMDRWGIPEADERDLLVSADRCLGWIDDYGDRDGDGFVEYSRMSAHGLVNQGWKDSWDAISFADGSLAQAPIALCEEQGYVYAAFTARARLARRGGDEKLATHWEQRASALKRRFNEAFWLPEHGYYALALDAKKRPVDALASNMGHCLWSGIVDDDKAPLVAERLLAPDMFSGWGIRTLSTRMGAYNPVSYHNGSVWPHDSAIAAAGLMRYGFVEEAQRIALALFEATEFFGGRLPELFCGFSRAEYGYPVPYPNACMPQAWASCTPFSLIRTLLGLDVDVRERTVTVDPHIPDSMGGVQIENLLVGGHRVGISVIEGATTITGLPGSFTTNVGAPPSESRGD